MARSCNIRVARKQSFLLIPDFGGLPRTFWVLFVGTLVNRVGGFALVFLAIYLTEERGLTPAQAGAIMAAYGIGAFAGGPFGGALADRVGRRPTLVLSLMAGGMSMLALGLVTTVAAITVMAAVTGALYEMYRPVVSATLADIVTPALQPRAFSLIYWAVNLGASIAPLLGGVIAAQSYRALFAADAATTMLFGVILWRQLPETKPVLAESGGPTPGWARAIFADHVFLLMCLLSFAFCIVFFQLFTALPIDLRARGVSTSQFGGLIALNGALIVLLQPSAGELISGRSRPAVLAVASLLLGVGFGMNAWAESLAVYAASVAIWTLGEILFSPAATTLVADMSPVEMRGRYQGVFATAFTGAFAAAPALGGYVIAHAGARALWIGCLVTGMLVAAGFIMLRPLTRNLVR